MSATTLRVVLDGAGAETPHGVGRYTIELTRELIATAPRGCSVTGFVPSSPEADYDRIEAALPGLASLAKSALDRRQLAAAWQHGFSRLPGTGMVQAPSLLAPLYRHDPVNNPGEQFVVTMHDAVAWMSQVTMFLMLGLLVLPSKLVPVAGVGLVVSAPMSLYAAASHGDCNSSPGKDSI